MISVESPQDKREVTQYFDRWTKVGGYPTYRPEQYRQLLKKCPRLKKPGQKVLDVGCGVGYVAAYLKEMGHQVVGLDLSGEAVEEAMREGRIDVGIVGDALKTKLPSESFDVIVLWGACVIPDIEGLFKECYRLLKRDGEVFLLEHNYRNPYIKLAFTNPRWWERWVEGVEKLRVWPITEKRAHQAGGSLFVWEPPAYEVAFTAHPNAKIDFIHRMADAFFRVMRALWAAPWTGNLITLTGRKYST